MVPTLAELEELDGEAQELPGVVLDMDNLSRCAPLCARSCCTPHSPVLNCYNGNPCRLKFWPVWAMSATTDLLCGCVEGYAS